jgi:hypothetical protein
MKEMGHPVSHLLIDHDGKYGKEINTTMEVKVAPMGSGLAPRIQSKNCYGDPYKLQFATIRLVIR